MCFKSQKLPVIITVILGLCVALEAKVITITNSNDYPLGAVNRETGLCLRDAANQALPGDIIDFNLKNGGTIKLKSTITFTGSTILNGNGVTIQAVTPGSSPYPLFNINFNNPDTGKVVFNDVTLRGGGQGAILVTAGTTDLNSCVVRDTKNAAGGCLVVYAGGTLNMTDCTVTNNQARSGNGGGIYNAGISTLTRCTLNSNRSSSNGSGIYTSGINSSVTIVNSTIANNTSTGGSGAVYIDEDAAANIVNASICYNKNSNGSHGAGIANYSSSGLLLCNSIVAGNISAGGFSDIDNEYNITGWNNAVGQSVNYSPRPGDWTTVGGAAALFTYASYPSMTGYLNLSATLRNNGGITSTLALTAGTSIAKNIDPYYPAAYEALASDAADFYQFGQSVAVSADGNTAIIGAYNTVGSNENQGTVYVFTRSGSTWAQQQELTTSDGAAGDQFGSSVAISANGTTAVIGAMNKNSIQGAAYIFTRNGSVWSQQGDSLSIPSGPSYNIFGSSVAISGDGNTVIVGANGKIVGSKQGAAYVFTRSGSTWAQQQELTSSDGAAGDFFGTSAISSDGNTAVIGAGGKNYGQGAVYVFTRSGSVWTQDTDSLTASDGAQNDNFGNSVSVSSDGSIIVIGAPDKNSSQGAAYVFVRSIVGGSSGYWAQQAKLTAGEGRTNIYGGGGGIMFGASVTISADGNNFIIGAPGFLLGHASQSYMYVHNDSSNTWDQQDLLVIPDHSEDNNFGNSVAMSSDGSAVVIGANSMSVSYSIQGAAYMYYGSLDTGAVPDSDQRNYVRIKTGISPKNCIGAFEHSAAPR